MGSGPSDFSRTLAALSRSGIRFVVVGVGGINFFAASHGEAFATLDLDLVIEPSVESLRSALATLASEGFAFEAAGEPFVDLDDPLVLSNVLRSGGNVVAISPDEARVDLMLSMKGFDFPGLVADAVPFTVANEKILVGRLEKLLRSKELSDRPKDRAFLEAFRARAETPAATRRNPRTKKKSAATSSKKKTKARPK